MNKIGRNTPCPCGSGKKYKHCCVADAYTVTDRDAMLRRLQAIVTGPLVRLMAELAEEFEPLELDLDLQSEEEFLAYSTSMDVFHAWALFDELLDDGSRIVDVLLAPEAGITSGARAFLESMRRSTMRLYEVVGVQPGSSIVLRDVVAGGEQTVHEPSGSRHLSGGELLVARVVWPGPSGRPELAGGLLPLPREWRDELVRELQEDLEEFRQERPGDPVDEFFKGLPPYFHAEWRDWREGRDATHDLAVADPDDLDVASAAGC